MSFQIPIVHLPRSITFASYIAFSASKGYLTLTAPMSAAGDLSRCMLIQNDACC